MKLCLNILKLQPLTFTALAAGIAFFSLGQASHAGFEWVPPAPAPTIENVQPAPPASATAPAMGESAPEDDAFLPLPGEEAAPAPLAAEDMNAAPEQPMQNTMAEPVAEQPSAISPVEEQQPAMNDSAPMPITSRPQQMKTLEMGAESNTHMQAGAPMQYEPMAASGPEATGTSMPMDIEQSAQPAPQPMAQPLPMPAEQPTQKAIMPADTPDQIKAAVANSAGKGLQVDPYPVAEPSAMREPFAQTPLEDKDVVGFGTDIPLALALQQVAPAGYAFSFGESVNPGAKVSWTGGDNWVNVMQHMIEPLGLQASIRGRVIFVSHQNEAAAPAEIIEPTADAPQIADAADAAATEAPASLEPAAIEPAAGNAQAVINRIAIKDPGQSEQAQPQRTLKVLSERQPLAKIAPEAGEERIVWEARKGDSLKETLESWGKAGNFDVSWSAMHDYTLESDILVAGEFGMALKSLINEGMSGAQGTPSFIMKRTEGSEKPTLIVKEPTV